MAIFIDANVPIYAAGQAHAYKQPCGTVLRLAADYPRAFWTNAEVLQELLHRYRAIDRWKQGRIVLTSFAELMAGHIEAVEARDVEVAAELAGQFPRLAARDLLHHSLMLRLGSREIVTADRGFEALPDVRRLDPADVSRWQALIQL